MRLKLLLTLLFMSLFGTAGHARGIFPVDQIYDFGGVGIDYLVYHDFSFVNREKEPVRLDSVKVACDCSRVWLVDSVVAPGDTGHLSLEFSTRDYYGRVSKALHLYTSSVNSPVVEFFYLTTVGQWFMGLQPKPASLFFLPGKEKLSLRIRNVAVEKVSVRSTDAQNDYVAVNVIKNEADKGSDLELEAVLNPNLPKGTIHTSFRIIIDMPEDFPEPAIISIPVKIVRF